MNSTDPEANDSGENTSAENDLRKDEADREVLEVDYDLDNVQGNAGRHSERLVGTQFRESTRSTVKPHKGEPKIVPPLPSGFFKSMESQVDKLKASTSTATFNTAASESTIRVGTFRLNGEIKSYAIIPKLKIHCQAEIAELMQYWNLTRPNFILETNAANKPRDNVITEENAPLILEEVFKMDRCKTQKSPYPNQDYDPTNSEESDTGQGAENSDTVDDDLNIPKPGSFEWLKGQISMRKNFCQGRHSPAEGKWMSDQLHWITDLKKRALKDKDYHPCAEELKEIMEISRNDWDWINRYLRRKTLHAVSSIVSAADISKGWVLCHGPPTSNEKIIESAMEITGSAPTVLVVDSADSYKGKGRDFIVSLADFSVPIKQADSFFLSGDRLPSLDVYDSYDILHRRGSTHVKSLEKNTAKEANLLPLWSFDSKNRDWIAHFPWKSGTHFIFAENFDEFDSQMLGPSGYLCMNGSHGPEVSPKSTGYMIREAIVMIKPCILFDNTGAETQMYARLIKKIQKLDREMLRQTETIYKEQTLPQMKSDMNRGSVGEHYEVLKLHLRRNAWLLLEDANRGQTIGLGPGEVLNLADIVQIVDLYCDNPRLFKKIVVPVDPLNDSPDDIVKAMTLSFARSLMEAREVGAGDADSKAVEQAWRLHYQLELSRSIKRTWRNILYSCYIIAGFGTTLEVVLNDPKFNVITSPVIGRWTTMALALIVSVSAAILNLISADSQLNKIQSAQAKIVFEIHRFRMRVGKYSLNSSERSEDDDTAALGGAGGKLDANRVGGGRIEKSHNQSNNLSTTMHESRRRFSAAIKAITQDLMALDLHSNKTSRPVEDSPSGRREFKGYVRSQLNLERPQDKRNDAAICGIMTPEDYYELRILPLLMRLEKEESRLRVYTRMLQISSMLCSSIAIVLGASAFVTPIPAVIAASTGLFQFLKVNDYERRFEITSGAARELRSLSAHWESLSDLDHQMRSSIVHMVRTCEQLALQFMTTSAIQVDKQELGMDSDKRFGNNGQNIVAKFGPNNV